MDNDTYYVGNLFLLFEMVVVTYATDTSKREDWYFEYQYGAFYVFPWNGVTEYVDTLRQTYDPKSAKFCQAHLSLSEPLNQPITDQHIGELMSVLSKIPPFEVAYGPLKICYPYPGVVYDITSQESFQTLRATIHWTSLFEGISLNKAIIPMHMTVAEFSCDTIEKSEALLDELQGVVIQGTFLCDTIELAVPNNNFYFERVIKIPLGSHV